MKVDQNFIDFALAAPGGRRATLERSTQKHSTV
jgi:hypothetical protein